MCFQDGKLAICYAAHAGHVCVVRYLLNLKFDVSNLLTDKTVRMLAMFPLKTCTSLLNQPLVVEWYY